MRQAETERVKCVALQRHGLRPAEIAETILLAMPCLASAYALHHTTVAGSDTLSVEAICLVVGVAVAGFLGCSARLDARLGHDKTIYRSTAGHGITIGITLVPLTASLITLLIARPDWEQAVPYSPFPQSLLSCVPVLFIMTHYIIQRVIGNQLTLGESYIISTLISLLLLDTICVTLSLVGMWPNVLLFHRGHVALFLLAILCGIALIGILGYPFLSRARAAQEKQHGGPMHIIYSLLFITISAGVVFLAVEPWAWLAMGSEPFTWTLGYILDRSTWRPYLIIYWVALISGAIKLASTWISNASSLPAHINFRRKYFHAIALLLFVPGYILEPELMHLSFSVAMGMLIYIEYVRIYHVGPVLPETMDRFVHQFMDARDQSVTLAIDDSRKGGINRVVVISHLSLLIGCAVPVWLVSIISSIDSIPYVLGLAGVLSLGVGDSLASIVGKSYGRTRWYMRGKTVEGTIGFVTGLWSAMYIVHLYVDSSGYSHDSISSRSMVVAAVFTGLLEAFSEQNDNLVVPLYLFSVLSLTLVWKL
ncbi:hypothetical protein BASA61_009267 [Batrachochytrium salamandrivorans]|nr:hypothetical protein BASA60_009257 [Batrachochytrium salamandrivorans]KAH6574790.1 hypothetical protein BASA62_002277 [Batrachochytrium salamandrivorans]KAH6581006.1 hypothetical protein BASA61_009267 [Batrachochytrium salamandrivorans]